ncbi:MAG: hypothetical protein ACYTBR_06045 [Planctomycetota bacterium]
MPPQVQEPPEPTCPICDYSLRGLPEAGCCPECGCSYDPRLLSVRTARPRGGWAYLLTVPLAAALAMPGLTDLGPVGLLLPLIFAAWCWHVSKRMAAWRCEVRARAYLRGVRSKPPPYFRRAVQYLVLAASILLIFSFWAAVH